MKKWSWEKVTSRNQLKEGSEIKIIGKNKNSNYESVFVEKIASKGKDLEIIINIKKNYFFNLDAYLENRPMWGGWVKDLFYKKYKKNCLNCKCLSYINDSSYEDLDGGHICKKRIYKNIKQEEEHLDLLQNENYLKKVKKCCELKDR